MHLKILIALVTLELISVSAKAKGSPQGFIISVPVPYPVPGYGFSQNYGAQPTSGAAVPYQIGFPFGNNFGYPANAIRGPILVNPQTYQGANYQQQIPVPVAYPSGASSSYAVQSANNYGRLWPKNLVNPNGTPSPPISGPDPLNYVIVSSTPSPIYQSTRNYDSSNSGRNSQNAVSTPSSITAQQQPLPVQSNYDSRGSFQPNVVRYNNDQVNQNVPIFVSTVAPYLANHQQHPLLAVLQNLQVNPSLSQYLTNYQHPTASPYVVQYQPSAFPFAFQNQVTASPAPYLLNQNSYIPAQPSASSFVNQNQRATSPAPIQQPTQSTFVNNYQRPITTPSPFLNFVNNNRQQSAASYVAQQSAPSPFVRNYQPSAVQQQAAASPFSNFRYFSQLAALQQSNPSPPVLQYQQPAIAAYVENDETTPTVLIGQHKPNKLPAQNQIQPDPTKPASTTPPSTTVPHKTHSVTIVSTTPIPQTPEVTEESVFKSTTPTPVTLHPEIIKTEYTGLVSPQYNHITSTPSSIRTSFGALVGQPSYVPLKNFNGYSSSVSRANYNGLGANYNRFKL